MDKINYNKPALSITQQIELLESRGLVINDKKLAEIALSNLNYYRLSGYWTYFEKSKDIFKENAKFENVLELYEFEKSLRDFIFKGISRFEVSLRTQFSYHTGTKYGSHSYLEKEYAKNEVVWQENIKKVQTELERSKEEFIKHYKEKYTEKFPPIWVICEIFSFGSLSCWYKNLKEVSSKNTDFSGNAKDDIAVFYKLPSTVLESWIHSLSVLRNYCAHQSRLILKKIVIQPVCPKSKKIEISSLWIKKSNCFYNLLLVLFYLNKQIKLPSKWRNDFISFLQDNSEKCIELLNFPKDWQDKPFWQI